MTRYFKIGFAGLLLGAICGVGLLYVNPLTTMRASEIADLDRVLRYALPGDAAVLTHGGSLPLPAKPEDVEALWETTVKWTLLGTIALSDADGRPAAIASRMTIPSEGTELLTGGLLVTDYWLVTVPGEGSLQIVGESNLWPVVKDALPVALLGRAWEGPRTYEPTVGPGSLGAALVRGATGRFAALTGRARERYRVGGFTQPGGLEDTDVELHFRLDQPSVDSQAE